MKIDAWVWVALKATTAIAMIAATAFWLKHVVDQTENSNQKEIDQWVDEKLAEALSQKLNQPMLQVIAALRHPDDSPINREIQQRVRSVDLRFSKESAAQIVMKLSVLYQDGSKFSAATHTTWDNLPSVIRKDFLKTGSQSVRMPCEFSAIKVS